MTSLGLRGNEIIDVRLADAVKPLADATLSTTRAGGSRQDVVVTLRIDTPIEVDCCKHGGILPCVLRQLLAA